MNRNKFIEFYEFLKKRNIRIIIKDKKYDCYDDFIYLDKINTIYLNKEKLIDLTDEDINSIMNSKYPKEALIERTRDFFKELSEESQEELMAYIDNCCCEKVAVEVVRTSNTKEIKSQEKKNTYAAIISHSIGEVQAFNTYRLSTNSSLAKRDDFLSILEFVSSSEADNSSSIRDILSSKTCQKRSDLWDIIYFINHFKSQLKDDFKIRQQLFCLFSDPHFMNEKYTLHYAKILSQATLSDNAEYLNEIIKHIKKTHPEVLSREDFSFLAIDVAHSECGVAKEVYIFLDEYEKEDSLKEEEIEMARIIAKAKEEEQAFICRKILEEQYNKKEKGSVKLLVKNISITGEEQAKLAYHFFETSKKQKKKDQDRFSISKTICNFSNEKIDSLKVNYSDYLIDYFSYENQKSIILYLNSLATEEELQQFKKQLLDIVKKNNKEFMKQNPYFDMYSDQVPLITEKIVFPTISSEYLFWDLFVENQEKAIEYLKEIEEENTDIEQNQKIYRKINK